MIGAGSAPATIGATQPGALDGLTAPARLRERDLSRQVRTLTVCRGIPELEQVSLRRVDVVVVRRADVCDSAVLAMVNRDRRGRRYIGKGHLDVGRDRGPGRLNVEGPGCARLEGSAEAVEGLGHVGAGTTLETAVVEGDLRGDGRPS